MTFPSDFATLIIHLTQDATQAILHICFLVTLQPSIGDTQTPITFFLLFLFELDELFQPHSANMRCARCDTILSIRHMCTGGAHVYLLHTPHVNTKPCLSTTG